jgi:hypothetical protein
MRTLAPVLGLVLTVLSACDGGSLKPSGAAGSGGSAASVGGTSGGGNGGIGGNGSSGGTGGLPACGESTQGQADVVEVLITGADGLPVAAPVAAAVRVTAIDSCLGITCPFPATAAATRLTLAGPAPQQWTLYLRNTAMPPGIINLGDTFDLTVDATVDQTLFSTTDQTIVLTRAGAVIAFAVSLQKFYRLAVPNLTSFGIAVTDTGAVCQVPASSGCITRPHTALIERGANPSLRLASGQTGRLGDLQVTVGQFTELADTGNCDAKSPTVLAGFRLAGS